MRGALTNAISLEDASSFFERENLISDPDTRKYLEKMIWEIDGSPGKYGEILDLFEREVSEEEFVRLLKLA